MARKDPEATKEYMREYYKRPEVRIKERLRLRRRKEENKIKYNIMLCVLQKKWNDESLGRKNHRRPWTEQEIALLWKTTHTTRALATLLDRSFRAIRSARYRFIMRRPIGYVHNGNQKIQPPETN